MDQGFFHIHNSENHLDLFHMV